MTRVLRWRPCRETPRKRCNVQTPLDLRLETACPTPPSPRCRFALPLRPRRRRRLRRQPRGRGQGSRRGTGLAAACCARRRSLRAATGRRGLRPTTTLQGPRRKAASAAAQKTPQRSFHPYRQRRRTRGSCPRRPRRAFRARQRRCGRPKRACGSRSPPWPTAAPAFTGRPAEPRKTPPAPPARLLRSELPLRGPPSSQPQRRRRQLRRTPRARRRCCCAAPQGAARRSGTRAPHTRTRPSGASKKWWPGFRYTRLETLLSCL